MDQVTITLNLHPAEMYHNKGNLNGSQVICNLVQGSIYKETSIHMYQFSEMFTKKNYRGLGPFFRRPRAVLQEPQSKVKVNEKLMVQGYTA